MTMRCTLWKNTITYSTKAQCISLRLHSCGRKASSDHRDGSNEACRVCRVTNGISVLERPIDQGKDADIEDLQHEKAKW